ncbi:MAG: hypothetical protein EA403_13830 [Spirochaetaceae bacterium]|nr:MAG: hypothetical protein EA403_13830 [Spirochaetaceae bacterium]
MKPHIRGIVPHVYRTGESYEYLFEVTEASYSTEQLERLPMIKELLKIEELIIRYRLSTVSVEAHEVKQKIELVDTRYREVPSERLIGSNPRATEFQPLSSLIPGFPENLAYRFTGGDFIAALNQACGPYLSHPLGIFLHYKLIDVHSFQSVVDDIGSRESPGDIVISPSEDIAVEHGVFHNHEPVRLYHRVDLLDGVRHAYFKVQTMGNVFRVPQQGMEMHTNYQMTFHVPLEGEATGLVSSGEQQELGYTVKAGEPITAIQRQISLRLQSGTSRSGLNWEAE